MFAVCIGKINSKSNFNGFYLGIDASLVRYGGTVENRVDNDITSISNNGYVYQYQISYETKGGISDLTPKLQMSAGYGTIFKDGSNSPLYFGGEIFADTAPMKDEYYVNGLLGGGTVYTIQSSVESDYSFGGALKLGLQVMPHFMFYALLGVELGNFRYKFYSTDIGDYSFDKNQFGFKTGIGIEQMLSKKLSLKIQYSFTDYAGFNNTTSRVLRDQPRYKQILNSYDAVNINRSAITVGLVYHFTT